MAGKKAKSLEKLKSKNNTLLDFFTKATKINRHNLSKNLAENSALMFRIGVIKADAELLMGRAKNKVEVVKSAVDKAIRKSNKGSKKLTEAAIKTRIDRHELVMAATDLYLEAKWKSNICETAAHSIKEKGENLRAKGYQRKAEARLGSSRIQHDAEDKVKDYDE